VVDKIIWKSADQSGMDENRRYQEVFWSPPIRLSCVLDKGSEMFWIINSKPVEIGWNRLNSIEIGWNRLKSVELDCHHASWILPGPERGNRQHLAKTLHGGMDRQHVSSTVQSYEVKGSHKWLMNGSKMDPGTMTKMGQNRGTIDTLSQL